MQEPLIEEDRSESSYVFSEATVELGAIGADEPAGYFTDED